jgi:hypothetical protein
MALRYITAWKVAGAALMLAGIISSYLLSFAGWRIGTESKLLFWILVALFPILAVPGAFLFWRGRQYAAQASAEGVLTDAEPHLLYLRPFRSDETTRKQVFGPRLTTSEEEQLADVLRPFGELVAIGRPGESLPTPGAARFYVSDEEWKSVVKRQMQAIRLVVIRAGSGENVLWELTQAVRTVEPQKLLILVLEMGAEDYESFRTKANPIVGVSLPERRVPWRFARVFGFKRVSGFISFAADWKPSFLALEAPYFRSGSFKRLAKYALRPIFESFGIEWQPPSISVSQLAGVVPFIILGLTAVGAAAIIMLGLLSNG